MILGDPHTALLDDAVTSAAAAQRAATRTLAEAELDAATLDGVLASAVAVQARVTVCTSAGREVRGTVRRRCGSWLEVRERGSTVWVATEAIEVLTGMEASAGDEVGPPATTLRRALTPLLERSADVRAFVAGGTSVSGRLRALGTDVLVISTLDGEALCPLARLAVLATEEGAG